MSGILIFRLRRRRAVSTLIGGVIVLSLLLTALGTMVFVTQQYDQYQQTANIMAQYRNQQLSEDLVAISPGLTVVNSTISGWGTGCDGSGVNTFNCYDATISNLGTVGVQITRIYINSTGTTPSGCSSPNPQPCILNPTSTIAPYAFNQADEFLNPGEANHALLLALPLGVGLPDPNPAFPRNTIVIATSRGNVFSFQWPFQASVFGQSQSAFSQGNMKVAYTGTFDSKNEPGPVNAGSGGTVAAGYCHNEASAAYPYANSSMGEKLTGLGTYGDSGVLWFVDPWITGTNITGTPTIVTSSGTLDGTTKLYIYMVVINTGTTAYNPTAGTIDLMWYGSNHIDGPLIGVYYSGAFYPYSTSPSIPPGAYYYAIFQITYFEITDTPWESGSSETGYQINSPSVMFWGAASVTNGLNSNAENQSYYSGTIFGSGLWLRYIKTATYTATSGSCA
jgi:hypothetical protein